MVYQRQTGIRPFRVRSFAKTLGRGSYRPLLPTSCRPQYAYRGYRGGNGRIGESGKGKVSGTIGGFARDNSASPQGASDHGAPNGVFSVGADPGKGNPSGDSRTGHWICAVQSARARIPDWHNYKTKRFSPE